MSKLQLVPAGAPELVRSNQKDRFYTNYINTLLSDISREVLPIRIWLQWQSEIQLAAQLAYYGLTTIFGNQTLGEEYCNTIQVGPSRPTYTTPGFLRRTAAILVQAIGPYAIEKMLELFSKRIRERTVPLALNEQQYETLEKAVGFVEDLFTTSSRLHLALFYIQGLFYHFGKRIMKIRYLMIRYGLGDMHQSQMNTYKMLGWLIMLQLIAKFAKWMWNYYTKSWRKQELALPDRPGIPAGDRALVTNTEDTTRLTFGGPTNVLQTESQLKCPLCLEQCKVQTAVPCGHIFCWQCIAEWTSEKSECPLCRSEAEPQQLVCLQHFDL